MSDTISIKLHGFDQFERQLKDLPERIRVKALRMATSGAAKKISEKAGDLLGSAGGRRDIGVVTKASREGIRALIGPVRKLWYLKFREFGTSLHTVKARNKKILAEAENIAGGLSTYHQAQMPSGKQAWTGTGGYGVRWFGKEVQIQQPAKPFLRPAMFSKKEEALDVMGKILKAEIEKAFVIY